MEIKFKRFNPLTDTIKPFDCGDSDLNGFLLELCDDVPNATQHSKQLLAVTYLIEDIESGKTINRAGCRYITVDALKSAIEFYQRNHFERLLLTDDEEETVLMYYDLKRLSE